MPIRELLLSLWGFLRSSSGPWEALVNALTVFVLLMLLSTSWLWFRWRKDE